MDALCKALCGGKGSGMDEWEVAGEREKATVVVAEPVAGKFLDGGCASANGRIAEVDHG